MSDKNTKQRSQKEWLTPGYPFVTSSTVSGASPFNLDFSKVTQYIIVKNTGLSGSLKIGFTENGINGSNNITLSYGESISTSVTINTLFLSGAVGQPYSVYASLSELSSNNIPTITGSNDFGGVG